MRRLTIQSLLQRLVKAGLWPQAPLLSLHRSRGQRNRFLAVVATLVIARVSVRATLVVAHGRAPGLRLRNPQKNQRRFSPRRPPCLSCNRIGRLAGLPLNMPSTLMSSSISGQWTPCPSPMISQWARCSGVASDKRQDHASGTLMLRPSIRSATIESSVTLTDLIRASIWIAVLIPCFLDSNHVSLDQLRNPV